MENVQACAAVMDVLPSKSSSRSHDWKLWIALTAFGVMWNSYLTKVCSNKTDREWQTQFDSHSLSIDEHIHFPVIHLPVTSVAILSERKKDVKEIKWKQKEKM